MAGVQQGQHRDRFSAEELSGLWALLGRANEQGLVVDEGPLRLFNGLRVVSDGS